MKKLFLIVSALCMTLVGCVEHLEDYSVTSQKKITFQTAKYLTTRATGDQINGAKFTYDHFVTHAWSDAVTDESKIFMNHQKVMLNETANAWMPTQDYYWPNYSTVDFISYYPENTDKQYPVVEREKLTYTGYDVSDGKDDINVETNDLMYANKAVGYSGNDDRVNDDNGGANDSGYSGVPTLFNHALAQLEIRVLVLQPEDETSNSWEAVINHAKLAGYYTKGDLVLTLNDPATTHGIVGWTPEGEEKVGWTLSNDATAKESVIVSEDDTDSDDITVSSTGTGNGYVDGKTGCKSLFKAFVLPQTLTEQHFFDLKFTLKTYRDGSLVMEEADTDIRHIQLKTEAIPYWGMNQRIVYTIIINPAKNKITFDPAVVDWEDVSGDKGADEFLTARSYFTLPSEDDWQESNVWYAKDASGNVIAEMAKELVYYVDDFTSSDERKNRKYYQVVSVYPVTSTQTSDGEGKIADLSKGLIAQVTMCEDNSDISAMAGGTISMYPRHQRLIDGTNTTITGNYVIKSMTWGNHANYNYVFIDKDGTFSLDDTPGSLDVEWDTEAYKVKDYDGNAYPVVKVGASYWLRENLKATTYSDNTKVKNFNEVVEDDRTPCTTTEDECVFYYERQPMYKDDAKYGRLYNYMAASGAEGENGGYTNADAWIEPGNSDAVLIQKGMDGYKEDETNLSIAPKGWHIVTAGGWYGCYAEQYDDEDYVRMYLGFDFSRAMDRLEDIQWQDNMRLNNISGLSIVPVPADGENFTFNDITGAASKENQMEGVVIPFWTNLLNLVKIDAQTIYWYPNPACYVFESNHNVATGTVILTDCINYSNNSPAPNAAAVKYYKEAAQLYLPIRCVRNTLAYD